MTLDGVGGSGAASGHPCYARRATLATMAFERLSSRLLAAGHRLEAVRPAVEAGSPWPRSPIFGAEPEASWNPPELLAHLAEMLPYWLAQVERILAGYPEPVPFGRVQTDATRIAAIGRDRALPPDELFYRIAVGVDAAVGRFATLGPDDATRRATHPTRGEMTLEAVVERMLVGHLEEHATQLEGILQGDSAPSP